MRIILLILLCLVCLSKNSLRGLKRDTEQQIVEILENTIINQEYEGSFQFNQLYESLDQSVPMNKIYNDEEEIMREMGHPGIVWMQHPLEESPFIEQLGL